MVATAALLAMAAPILTLRSGEAGVSTLPIASAAKQGYEALNAEFPAETTAPVEVVIAGGADSPAVAAGIERLRVDPRSGEVLGLADASVERSPELTVLTVPVRGDALDADAVDAVRELRAQWIPTAFGGSELEVLVAGDTAETIDESDTMTSWLPAVLAFVLGLSFVLLTIAFRSLVDAAKAIAANVLSVAAAYGVLVGVFQFGSGRARGLHAGRHDRAVGAAVPVRGAVRAVDGLSRVPVEPDPRGYWRDRRRARAIADGVGRPGAIITGAALIIVAVFSGFARGDLVMSPRWGSASPSRSCSTRPSSGWFSCRRRWSSSASATGILPPWLSWLPDVRVEGPGTPPARAR